jgi:photosystem II stability/assembly factor-like uncharacterized protein
VVGRLWRGWLTLLVFLALAGCGSAVLMSTAAASSRTAGQRCARLAHLVPGVSFAAWHLGAVLFSSPASGVGLTTNAIICDHRLRSGGIAVGYHRQVAQLASTSNGGRSWRLIGSRLPAVASLGGGPSPQQLVATSSSALWALVGTGRVVGSADAGARWTTQPVPGTVSKLEVADGSVWALTCIRVRLHAFPCLPQLWRARQPGSHWSRVRLPRQIAQDAYSVQLGVTRGSLIVGVIGGSGLEPSFRLWRSTDQRGRWTVRVVSWRGQPCQDGTTLATAPPSTAWLLCNTRGARDGSDKSLLQTTDGGRSWRMVSSVNLTDPSRAGQLQRAEPMALTAGSSNRLWLSGDNDLTVSGDGGRRWDRVRNVNPQGALTTFDFLDATHGWLLGLTSGLWRTTDGVHWLHVGPVHTS